MEGSYLILLRRRWLLNLESLTNFMTLSESNKPKIECLNDSSWLLLNESKFDWLVIAQFFLYEQLDVVVRLKSASGLRQDFLRLCLFIFYTG